MVYSVDSGLTLIVPMPLASNVKEPSFLDLSLLLLSFKDNDEGTWYVSVSGCNSYLNALGQSQRSSLPGDVCETEGE